MEEMRFTSHYFNGLELSPTSHQQLGFASN
jgi:hypothetical protein